MKLFFSLVLLFLVSASAFAFKDTASRGEKIYMLYCVGCHAQHLEGTSSAPTLKKQIWKNGTGRKAINLSIRNGFSNTIMIGWKTVLTEKDLDAITDYIVKAQLEIKASLNPGSNGTGNGPEPQTNLKNSCRGE